MSKAADERAQAEDEQHVADDGTGQRGFDQIRESVPECQRADDQLSSVAESGVEQSAESSAEAGGEYFRGTPDDASEREYRHRRGGENPCVTLGSQKFQSCC